MLTMRIVDSVFKEEVMPTLKELLAQQAELAKQIEEVRRQEVTAAIQSIRKIIEEYELEASDVFPGLGVTTVKGESKIKKPKAPAKYRSSLDPSKTWSGKGKPPDWFKTYRDNNGGNVDGLLIEMS